MHHGELDIADHKLVAVVDQLMAVLRGVRILPLGRTFIGNVKFGPDAISQFSGPRNIVGVNMGFGDRRDFDAFALGGLKVLFDVAARIDDNRLLGSLAADRTAGEPRV